MSKAILECRKLRKLYRGEGGNTLALDSFSASFPSTGLVAVTGKSGCGKSTLLCLLSLMEKPTSGKVYFLGKDVSKFKRKEKMRFLREDSAFVFQHYGLFEDKSVLDNVMIPLRMTGEGEKKGRERALFMLDYLHLEDKENQIVSTLSGGEKQRVALARALVKSPKVLFCDEPTGALDEKNGVAVMEMISSMSKTRLVIMVSHNEKLVSKYADRTIVMEDGKIKEDKVNRKVPEAYEDKKLHVFSSRWATLFFKGYLLSDFKRNFLTFLSGSFGSVGILLSIAYMHGNGPALKKESQRSLEYLSAQISKKEVVSTGNSPLSLTRTIKPKLEEAEEYLSLFSSISIEEDLSYFLPNHAQYSLGENQFNDASFLPIFDITLEEYGSSFLREGERIEEETINVCYVNDLYASTHPDIIGKKIELALTIPFEVLTLHEEVNLYYSFEVKGVMEEFSFLNVPKIYYSYPMLKQELRSIALAKLSEAFKREISVYDCIDLGLGGCNAEDYQVYFHDPSEIDKAYSLMEKGGEFTLTSSCYMSYSSLSTLSKAFEVCLWLLFGICLAGVIAITAMSFLSLYFKRRKEIALQFSLGAKNSEVIGLFTLESILVSVLYFALAFIVYPFVAKGFNQLLGMNFGINSALTLPEQLSIFGLSVPFFVIVAVAALVLAILSSALPIGLSLRKGLRTELRDE
ncbi:MAG: ABC transporter ATP-binding protein/permease [Bacilli bacterium]|nr:ABC transporter ATP-binding protein/permease [Bacilli bacterium]